MKHFFALTKIQILGSFKGGKSKIKRAMGPFFVLLLGALIAYIGYTYSNIFYEIIVTLGNEPSEIIPIMVGLAFFVTIMYSFYVTGNALYSTKDYDLLSAMPIKTVVITSSKLLSVLLKQIAIILLIGIPSVFIYGSKTGVISDSDFYLFVIKNVIMMIFSGFLGTAISVFLGSFISIIFSKFRHKNLIQIIFLVLIFGVFFYYVLIDGGGYLKIASILNTVFFIKPLYITGMYDWLYVLIVLSIGIGSIALITFYVTVTYKKFNALLLSKKTNKKFRLKNYSRKSLYRTLYRKEMMRLFTCPMYAVNTLIGLFLSILSVTIIAAFFKDLQLATGTSLGMFVIVALPMFYSFLYWLSPTTVAAVSLEGKSLWFVKSSPIPIGKLFNVKILIQLTFAIPSALICSLILVIMLKTDIGLSLLIFATGLVFATFGAVLGLAVNIIFPKFDYESEAKVVKNSLAAFIEVVISFAFTVIFIVIISNIKGIEQKPALFVGIMDAVILAVGIVIYSLIMTKGKNRFMKA